MESALPIVAGVLCGLVSALPYAVVVAHLKRTHAADILPGVAAVVSSLFISVVSILVAWYVARESVFVFAVALAAVFFVVVVIAAVWFMHRSRS